ncbi:MAG: GyrI-like domain-containing protein [Candidatus Poribacteria bacterium]|nr:GyrI-like domain-containing protein [Candidatus Poribacteria bacterium]
MNNKLDLKKEYKRYFYPDIVPEIFRLEPFRYLLIEGSGSPDSKEFSESCSTLFSAMYTIKFQKKNENMDFIVPPLEGLWWSENISDFANNIRDNWQWLLMIMLPEYIVLTDLKEALIELKKKNKKTNLHEKLRIEKLSEDVVVQVMYEGPFSGEGDTIRNMHSFAETLGYELIGKHHEIYLSDFRRTDPQKLKTVLRQPIKLISK